MRKKFSSIFLILALSISMLTPVLAAEVSFHDLPPTHWAYSHVMKAAQAGWVSGVGNDRFEPESEVTGAEFITMIVRSFYADELGPAASVWYKPYVDVANQHNLLSDGTVDLNDTMERSLNRMEMAFIASSVAREQKVDSNFDPSALSQSEIPDLASIPAEYHSCVGYVYHTNILTGVDDNGTFQGTQSMTRAQAAVVLCALHDLVDGMSR